MPSKPRSLSINVSLSAAVQNGASPSYIATRQKVWQRWPASSKTTLLPLGAYSIVYGLTDSERRNPNRMTGLSATKSHPNTMIHGQPAEVREQFLQTAGHPKATYRVVRAPQGSATVQQGYREFLALWRNPGPDRPEVAIAKECLVESGQQPQRFKPDTLVH